MWVCRECGNASRFRGTTRSNTWHTAVFDQDGCVEEYGDFIDDELIDSDIYNCLECDSSNIEDVSQEVVEHIIREAFNETTKIDNRGNLV